MDYNGFSPEENSINLIPYSSTKTARRLIDAYFCSKLFTDHIKLPFSYIIPLCQNSKIVDYFIDGMVMNRFYSKWWTEKRCFSGGHTPIEVLFEYGSNRNINLFIKHFKPILSSQQFLIYSKYRRNSSDIESIRMMVDESGLKLDSNLTAENKTMIVNHICEFFNDINIIKYVIYKFFEQIAPRTVFQFLKFIMKKGLIRNNLINSINCNKINDNDKLYLINLIKSI
jgi:hypothetical protein